MTAMRDPAPLSASTTGGRLPWAVPLLVAALTFLVFAGTLNHGFVNWDDQTTLVKNQNFRSFSSENLRWMLTSFHVGHWRPVTWLSFALDYRIWGMDARGYHLTNVLLHSATAAAFCVVIRQLLGLAGVATWSGRRLGASIALAALAYSVHPLRAECVSWVTDRLDVLSGFWWMLAVWGYLRAQARAGRYRRWLSLSLVFYALSMLSKGMGMTLPAVLLILDVYPLRRLGYAGREWFRGRAWRVWVEKVPFGVIGLGGGAMAFLAKQAEGGMLSVERLNLGQRIAQMFYNQAFYLWKTIWPTDLVPLYPARPDMNPLEWQFLFSGSVVAVLTVVLILLRKRWPVGLTAWGIYLIVLLPVSGLSQSGTQIAADRYSYLPCLGFSVLLAGGLASGKGRRIGQPGEFIGFGLCAFLVLVLAWLSVQQASRWKDSETLWRYTISVHPGGGAYNNLGVALTNQGRMDEARAAFEKSLEFQPYQYEWRTNLADALRKLDREDEAIALYEQVVRNTPQYTNARRKLIQMLAKRRTFDRAVRIGREGLRYATDDPGYKNVLAWLLATCPVESCRDGMTAVLLAQEAVSASRETRPEYLGTLAAALAEVGEYNEAVATAKRALALAEKMDMREYAAELNERIELYKAGRPYHEK